MSLWDAWTLLSRLLGLLGVAAVTGGTFSLFLGRNLGSGVRSWLSRYILWGAVLGLLATALFFLVQLGAINRNGLSGMFDLQMGMIIGQSPLGYTTGLRLIGFILAITAVLLCPVREAWRYSGINFVLGLGSLTALILSFTLMGHVVELAILARLGLVIHVVAVFLWVGSLYPLWHFCRAEVPVTQVKTVMTDFGRIAGYFLPLLIIAGIYLLTQLLETIDQLLNTAYGQTMLIKLLLAVILMTLGALNRMWLVPHLDTGTGKHKLAGSIGLEMVLALFILTVTAHLTTNVGL